MLVVGFDLMWCVYDLLLVLTEKLVLPDSVFQRRGGRADRLIDLKDVDGVAGGGEVDCLLHKAA